MPACAANAMQCAEGFVLERALVLISTTVIMSYTILTMHWTPQACSSS